MIQTICHLIASREHGGLEKHVADLSRWQAHHSGAQVAVIAHPRYQTMLDEAVKFIPLNTDRNRHHPTLTWRLANQIRAGAFQIVHGHGSKSAQLLAAVQPYTNALQVITRHNVRHPRDKLASAFDARIAVSRTAVANSRLPWNIIPNGVDIEPVVSSQPVSGATAHLLVAARLVKIEQIDQLLLALPSLPGARLTLLGDGPEKTRLQGLCRELHLAERVEFVEESTAEKRSALMRAADLAITCARGDQVCYTVVEALLHRCPVLSTRVGDTAEILPAPYVLDDIAPALLAEKLRYALEDRARLRRDFVPAFERAAREFTLERMARATWQVYTELAAQNNGGSAIKLDDTAPRIQPVFARSFPRD